jgi:homospermidine synthase
MPDIVISLTVPQALRVQSALATPENPAPTVADAKAWLIRQLRAHVIHVERRDAQRALAEPTEFDPT